ncbi:MAG: glycosyltransferase [Bacteroidia bacterium]|nr:glycosyltransferase [Bacteroidia bacterium]
MTFWEGAFWITLSIVLYPYFFYPIVLFFVGLLRPAERNKPSSATQVEEWPEVTLVIPAYKEVDSVQPKMDSIRSLDYPADKIRILWIISTHEGDETLTPTLAALEAYPEAEYILVPHLGKNAALNRARSLVRSPLTLITDANAILSPSSLRSAVQCLQQTPVGGAVGGRRLLLSPKGHTVTPSESTFLSFEHLLKKAESTIDCALGLSGEFLLLETALWPEIPPSVVDDLYIVLNSGLSGKPLRYEPKAVVYEAPSPTISIEFQRKSRIAYTVFHTLRARFRLRDALRYPKFTFMFLSHKFSRYFVAPIALVFLLILTGILSFAHPHLLYISLFILQGFSWIEAATFLIAPRLRLPGFLSLPGYFLLAHWAQLWGLWRFLRREDPLQVWKRLPRTETESLSHVVEHTYSTGSSAK